MQPISNLDTHNMNKILKEYNMQPINHLDTHNMNKRQLITFRIDTPR